ncbi:MAG TPA: ferritin family protein [Thermodesulfobacteriota bacterium]|nr:ferritin family protein [Thermodesulfobacteriota bacterium]
MAGRGTQRMIDELATAHNTEIAGYFFYNTAAELIEDEKGKKVFISLAKEELDHIKVVRAISDSLKKGGGWMSYEDAVKRGTPETVKGLPIFQKESELTERFRTNRTDQNAMNIAIENEDKAVDFYTRLLNEAAEPEEKVVLTRLLEMEKNHLKILRWEYEGLVKNGFWCGMMEYSVEKESE